jgi:hypothetical protein
MKLASIIFLFITTMCSCRQPVETNSEIRKEIKSSDTLINQSTKNHQPEYILHELLKYDSEEELIVLFKKENIKRGKEYFQEGMGYRTTTILFPDSDKEVEFAWNDDQNCKSILYVQIHKPKSVWKTSDGITYGTTLAELVKINKGDFSFYGFSWDFEGLVGDGFLSERPGHGISITLCPPGNYNDLVDVDSLIGDQLISSKSTVARKASLKVCSVRLTKY